MASLNRAVRPVTEPVPLPDLCAFCRLVANADGTYDDAPIVDALGRAARETVETETNRTLMPTTWALTLDGFPNAGGLFSRMARQSGDPFAYLSATGDEIRLFKPPLIGLVSVVYLDSAGRSATLDPTRFRLIGGSEGPARLAMLGYNPWPVTFPGHVPESALLAIKLLTRYWFDAPDGDSMGVPEYVRTILNNCDWGGALG